MNIGFDARLFGKGRAVSRYGQNILSSMLLETDDVIFYVFTDEAGKISDLSRFSPRVIPIVVPPRLTLVDHFFFSRVMKRYPLDVFFHPDNTEFLFCHPRSVVVLHDLIPWLYPSLIMSSDPFLAARQRLYLSLQEKALRRSAQRVLTVSEFSREDIVRTLGLDPDRVDVTYEGVDQAFVPVSDSKILTAVGRKYNLPAAYLFYVGGFDERKNLLRLLHAFAKTVEKHEISLVIGGSLETDELFGRSSFFELKKEIERMGLASLVTFTGFIEEGDLPAVYSLAKIFIYPSYYEGFGLPPLEAMACGVPVICSNKSSLPEICGEAALLVDPYVTEEFVSAVDLFLTDENLRRSYLEKGRRQVKKYTWKDVAVKTLAALRSL